MLPVGWLVFAIVAAVLLSMWITFTLTRLDRLHARVDAARAALDAQLVRRAAALVCIVEAPGTGLPGDQREEYGAIAQAALATTRPEGREAVENAVGRAMAHLAAAPVALAPDAAAELRETAARVQVARRFYNDAVRDTRTLRARRMPRLLRLAGRAELPHFFDIDDTVPPEGPSVLPIATRSAADRTDPSSSAPGETKDTP
jgi:hypothetical protein